MNDFDKTFVLPFCNSFVKVQLDSDKRYPVNFKYMQFSKEDVA